MSNDLLSTPARWNVDPSATHARFLARTLWGLIPVRGSLTARSGHLLVEPPSAGRPAQLRDERRTTAGADSCGG
jgi:hypothetical protein